MSGRIEPVRMAMIGGGSGSFIGPVHRIAAAMDGQVQLVAGAFSSDMHRSLEAGRGYGLGDERVHADWRKLLEAEVARPDGAEMVAIVTPNHLHMPIAAAALKAGLHVLSEKPATTDLAEALALRTVVQESSCHYGLAYTYTGYPLVRHARELVAAGAIGRVRKIVVEYAQGWLADPIERSGSKQASWRVDPAQAGKGGCLGDIGVHAFHLAEFVSGLRVTQFLADLATVVPGRELDDDCTLLLRFGEEARGILIASQVAIGELNGLRLRLYGDQGSLDWQQERPDRLVLHRADGSSEIIRKGTPPVGSAGSAATRLPSGHPEGYLEAFANIYRDFAALVRDGVPSPFVAGIGEGVRSMGLIETAVAASQCGNDWTTLVS